MAAKNIAQGGGTLMRQIKPIKSATPEEARKNVLAVYKKWMKQMPYLLHHYENIIQSHYEVRLGFKRQFLKNAHIRDLRVIDRLVNEAHLEFYEAKHLVTPSYTIMSRLFAEHVEPKPKDFLSKFFAGKN